jgi:hypothetical protein
LIAQFPDEKAKWMERFREIEEAVAQREADRREDETYQRKQKQARSEYRDEYVAFLNEYERVRQRNEALAKAVQERFNQPFTLWLLKYGVASVDEGETYLEVRETFVGEEKPNEEGWLMADGTRERFFFPVSVAKKKKVYPDSDRVNGFVFCRAFDGFGVEVHTHRSVTREDVERALIEAGVVPLPQTPVSSVLDAYQMERVRKEARRAAGVLEYDPVDYW